MSEALWHGTAQRRGGVEKKSLFSIFGDLNGARVLSGRVLLPMIDYVIWLLKEVLFYCHFSWFKNHLSNTLFKIVLTM